MLRRREKNNLYCQFLIAAQRNYTATELSERLDHHPAHDSITKWLESDHLTPAMLWQGMKESIDLDSGDLVIDHTVLDKWYSGKMGLVYRQYSGTHHTQVNGIGITNMLWYSKKKHIPIDYRLFDPKTDDKTRNEHARDMLKVAKARGLVPGWVLMDSEFSALATLKLINSFGWKFVAGIDKNRLVTFVAHQHHQVQNIPIPKLGCVVHLNGFGMVRIFKIEAEKRIDYLVSNDVTMSAAAVEKVYARRWEVEVFHRGLKQTTGVANCQARKARSQRNHIFCSIRTFLSLEKQKLKTGYSLYEQKKHVIEEAISLYLRGPTISLVQI